MLKALVQFFLASHLSLDLKFVARTVVIIDCFMSILGPKEVLHWFPPLIDNV